MATQPCGWFRDCWRRFNKEMTPQESLRMNAWQKWKHYRRPPWKFIINLALVICTTANVMVVNNYLAPYARANIASWEFLLQPPTDGGSDENGQHSVYYIYTVDALMESMENTIDTYYNLRNVSIDHFEHLTTPEGEIKPIDMYLSRYAAGSKIFDLDAPFDSSITKEYYNITEEFRGPFDMDEMTEEELHAYVHTLTEMSLQFSVMNFDLDSSTRSCFQWDIAANYEFGTRGRVEMTIDSTTHLCPSEMGVPWYQRSLPSQVFLNFAIAFLAGISQILHLRSLYKSIYLYTMAKRINSQHRGVNSDPNRLTWEALSCKDKMKFFNVWFFVATIGNVCNVVGSLMAISDRFNLDSTDVIELYFTGLGCMMSWLLVVQYFESSSSYYVLVTTLRKGTPRVARFLVGVLPVFLGYAMFGVAFFSTHSENFATLDAASVTLFSLLNGDVIHDIFDEIYPAHPFVSRVYLYSFISLFIYAVLNIFIAIVEDAFFASKAFQLFSQQRPLDTEDLDKVDPLEFLDFSPLYGYQPEDQDDHDHSHDQHHDHDGQHDHAAFDDTPDHGEVEGDGAGGFHADESVVMDSAAIARMTVAQEEREQEEAKRPRHGTKRRAGTIDSPMMEPLLPSDADLAGAPSDGPAALNPRGVIFAPGTGVDPSGIRAHSDETGLERKATGGLLKSRTVNFADAPLGRHGALYVAQAAAARPKASKKRTRAGQDLLAAIRQMQREFSQEFQMRFATFLNSSDVPPVRPPHDPSYYPCTFPDCAYCVVRATYSRGLLQLTDKLEETMMTLIESRKETPTDGTNSDAGSAGSDGSTWKPPGAGIALTVTRSPRL